MLIILNYIAKLNNGNKGENETEHRNNTRYYNERYLDESTPRGTMELGVNACNDIDRSI